MKQNWCIIYFMSIITLTVSMHVEINNIHNGYRFTFEGKSAISKSTKSLLFSPVQIIEDTIPLSELDFVKNQQNKIQFSVQNLISMGDIDPYQPAPIFLIQSGKTWITISMQILEDNIHEEDFQQISQFLLQNLSANSLEDQI